jgi:Flp pilus assembly pilin Flp
MLLDAATRKEYPIMGDVPRSFSLSAMDRIAERKGQRGVSVLEYAIMIVLLAAVIIAGVIVIGGVTSNAFQTVGNALP